MLWSILIAGGRFPLVIRAMICCLVGAFCAAGESTIALGSGSAAEGTSATLVLTLSGNETPASLQFKLTFRPVDFTLVEVAAGPAAKAAGKSVDCRVSRGSVTCLIWGMNSSALNNGIVAVVKATLSRESSQAARAIAVEETSGSTHDGMALKIAGAGGTVRTQRGRPR